MEGKTKEEKLKQVRERKSKERDRIKRIKKANKDLLVAPKKTQRSLGMIQLDPAGVMHFSNGRWVKILSVQSGMEHLPKVFNQLNSRVRFTHHMAASDRFYITLTGQGDIYEPVRRAFSEDEKILSEKMSLRPLGMEASAEIIRHLGKREQPFVFKDFMKKRRDLSALILPPVKEMIDCFYLGKIPGISFVIMQFPERVMGSILKELKSCGAELLFTFDLRKVTEKEREEYLEYLKTRYIGAADTELSAPFINASAYLTMLCKSDSQRQIALKKAEDIFRKTGFMIAPAFGLQREITRSVFSLGLLEETAFANVLTGIVSEFFIKEYGHDSD